MPVMLKPQTSAVMRRFNELVWDDLRTIDRAEPISFFCECGDTACYWSVLLTLSAYERARSDPSWAAIASEHAAEEDLERVF